MCFVFFLVSHTIHGTGIFPYIYHKNLPNVGKYTIHGWYEFSEATWDEVMLFSEKKMCFFFWDGKSLVLFLVNPGSWMIHAWDSLWCWCFSWRSRITGVFQVTSSSKKLRINFNRHHWIGCGFPRKIPGLIQSACFTWEVPKSNRRVIWFHSSRKVQFFWILDPMLGPQGCNHGIFCKNIRISRPSLNSRWWQLKYFFIFTPITWGNDPIWSNLTTVIFFKWVGSTIN